MYAALGKKVLSRVIFLMIFPSFKAHDGIKANESFNDIFHLG